MTRELSNLNQRDVANCQPSIFIACILNGGVSRC